MAVVVYVKGPTPLPPPQPHLPCNLLRPCERRGPQKKDQCFEVVYARPTLGYPSEEGVHLLRSLVGPDIEVPGT